MDTNSALPGKDLLGLEPLSGSEIEGILDTADAFRRAWEEGELTGRPLAGVSVANLFFEPSTRTRTSFELAQRRLGAEVVSLPVSTSAVRKGESLADTARTVEAMGMTLVVLRHASAGAAAALASRIPSGVVNAGDGAHEHPTQGLLDLLTLREKVEDFRGLRVCVVGDVLHSRVARSNLFGLRALGAEVAFCGPPTLLPRSLEGLGAPLFHRLEEALEWADVLNVLRLQLERMEAGYVPSLAEYSRRWGITRERLEASGRELLILHPGPMNRGVEIASDVADGPASLVLRQVENGVYVRMAVLYLMVGGTPEDAGEAARGAAGSAAGGGSAGRPTGARPSEGAS